MPDAVPALLTNKSFKWSRQNINQKKPNAKAVWGHVVSVKMMISHTTDMRTIMMTLMMMFAAGIFDTEAQKTTATAKPTRKHKTEKKSGAGYYDQLMQ